MNSEGFVLSNNWCVLSTSETLKTLNDYIKERGYSGKLYHNYYIHYPFIDGSGSAYNKPEEGYTEISFEMFEKYILNEYLEQDYSYLIDFLKKLKIT